GLGLHNYHDTRGAFPPALLTPRPYSPEFTYRPYQWISWMARLLPYVEQQSLWDQTQATEAQEGPNGPLYTDQFFTLSGQPAPWWPFDDKLYPTLSMPMKIYSCPADSRTLEAHYSAPYTVAFTAYLGVSGVNEDTRDGVLF